MNRRGFIRTVTTIIGGKVLGLDGIVSEVITTYRYPVSMYGIPYHYSDASTSEWLGFKREMIFFDNTVSLIEARNKYNWE